MRVHRREPQTIFKGRFAGLSKKDINDLSFAYTWSSTISTGREVLRRSNLTQAWRQRKISNFDYLMHLNTLAGRTFNDLTQYPVFPWILTDYKSETIDLNDESVYRDLSLPIGALTKERLKMFQDRYDSLDDASMGISVPPFHYGTHYSTAGSVLFYLIRQEPYCTLSILQQDGKFDYPDRLFDSIPMTWEGVLNNPADVKELIPLL